MKSQHFANKVCIFAVGSVMLLSRGARADIDKDGKADLLWYNPTTGILAGWLLNGATVMGAQSLSRTCDAPSGCSQEWKPVGLGNFGGSTDADLLWHNVRTGELSAWILDGATVTGTAPLSWRCDAASGCSRDWKVVGIKSFTCAGVSDVLWHNATTGEVAAWLMYGSTVTGAAPLSWRCDAASGCSRDWKVVGIGAFGGRTPSDVLWHNATTGEVSAWLTTGTPGTEIPPPSFCSHALYTAIDGAAALSWRCDEASGCSREWKVVGVQDIDYDGKNDLVWHNVVSGEVSAWLLDGSTVKGTQSLSWRCDAGSGCSQEWKVIGFVKGTIPPPR
jgi:hypothetical protein